ncbi:Ig-like domain-containing protein [uncultured Parabacteroides sp.]|uniref:Ig-like domain-containing protein n=1 Tax=uncultured Parabacteroides sp. TaxID=512312 RepID=UPI0025DB6A3E|nr:Ig-like domain-containing protein [uncultured Parabacteroides sp.]
MKKIRYAICLMALLLCACSEDKKDGPIYVLEPDYITADEIFESTGCMPDDAKSIKYFKLFKDSIGDKYLYGSKLLEGLESFWISKYSESGKQLWEVVHSSKLVSNAYSPVQLSNGNLVVGNVAKNSDWDVVSKSPVIVDKNGNANYLKVFDDNYIYSDVSVYKDFFFTTVSMEEIKINQNAVNRAAQIDNDGNIIRLIPAGTDDLLLPKKDDKFIWISDSSYVTMSINGIYKHYALIRSNGLSWSFSVNLPDYTSCEMNLSLKDTVIVASYFLDYNDKKKDTISYNLSPFTGKEVVELEDMFFEEKNKTVKEGDSFTLNLVFIPENASIKIIWESSDQSVATVDRFGKITAQSSGKCVIKATTEDGRFESTCDITVLEPTIEESIKVNVYGSYTSFNGFVTGDITAAFYNNSSKTVEVTDFTMYDTRTNKVIFQQENCGIVEYKKPLQYALKFTGVYKPLFLWKYRCEGKSYTCEYRM